MSNVVVSVKSIVFSELYKREDMQVMSSEITWTDGVKKTKEVFSGELSTPEWVAVIIGRNRIWTYADSMCDPEMLAERT